jgi:hypothetical protein
MGIIASRWLKIVAEAHDHGYLDDDMRGQE